MELVKGDARHGVLRQESALPWTRERLEIFREASVRAVQHAHQKGSDPP